MKPIEADEHFIETAYDLLANAIDSVGPARESLFLTKLALTLANEIGEVDVLERVIQTALRDSS